VGLIFREIVTGKLGAARPDGLCRVNFLVEIVLEIIFEINWHLDGVPLKGQLSFRSNEGKDGIRIIRDYIIVHDMRPFQNIQCIGDGN
jgi:hypothetical protein